MKRYKKEANGMLEVGQVLYTKHYALTVDRVLCKGCELCKLVCPREAISLVPALDSAEGKALPPLVDIDENKCDYHGICAVVCPFSAIQVMLNGGENLSAVKKDAFPTLTRDIELDRDKCPAECRKCAGACPLGAIVFSEDASLEIKRELCAGCQICWVECPSDAIQVSKFIEGSIRIQPDACPDGCHRCMDVCPVNALAVGEDEKVYAKDIHCIYCGACLEVCPSKEALEVERTAFRHTPVNSGAWHKGLERLTSPEGLMRELGTERVNKAKDAIKSLRLDGVSE